MAEVTKRHRELAMAAVHPKSAPTQFPHWFDVGGMPSHSSIWPELNRISQAIADAEERGTPGAQHLAWETARKWCAKYPGASADDNPYPVAPEEKCWHGKVLLDCQECGT